MATVKRLPGMVRKIFVAFSDCFNNLTLVDAQGVEKLIPIRAGSVSKILSMSQVTDESRNKYRYVLPLIGFGMTNMQPDTDRAYSKINTIRSADSYEKIRQPSPWNFNFDLYIMASKASQLFDIIEMIVPSYQQARYYPFVEYKFTDGSMIQRDIPIILDSTNIELKTDTVDAEEQMFSTTLSFTMKGYLHHAFVEQDAPIIQNIDLNYEEYVDGVYEKLINETIISEATGGEITSTTTGL